MDLTLAELQEMASRQQQQIEAQQQMLATKVASFLFILVEEIEQMNSLFQQKQKELVLAVSKVEELTRQLEMLKNGRVDGHHDNQSAVAELDRLYKELQLRNKLNQEQNAKLQQQRECLNRRNSEVAVMDKRVNELRDRLWKKKAALQQKENLPVSPDGSPPQQGVSAPSRVAAVGPYIQSSTMPRMPPRPELLVKPALPDGSLAAQPAEGPLKVHTLPNMRSGAASQTKGSKIHPLGPDWSPNADLFPSQASAPVPKSSGSAPDQVDDGEVPLREKEKKVRPFSMSDTVDQSAVPPSFGALRKNQSSEDILRDAQVLKTVLAGNSDLLAPSPGLDYVPEGVPDSSPTFQSSVEEPNPEAPHLLEVYLEEYPPYPPPPYPSGEPEAPGEDAGSMRPPEVTGQGSLPPGKRTNLRKTGSERIAHGMRVKFNPLALLLDSSLEGEFDLVQRIIYEVDDPSLPNDEGITALHNAVCAGHTEIVKFLVQFGVNVNAADSDGWTPLHCAASCNNVQVCKFLVESGAAVFAMTYSDMQTAADKCEEMEEGYTQCSQFLYGA
ncbi:apoptosis-stimulating of p53 protein 2-like [Pteropus vampyrus]|uniref:Apoptosis-stimulating of p53 protein 2-like n=1 Tax=Pteropus vampyrus TaxID=132908 RepID=A0A6P6C506_PTEVA|nr:apoptosis-stimulating of p53 protein 2-like [Pteropus vampyrus]